MMSIKLFATDLDGTLLPSGTRISDRNVRAIRSMVEAGVIFTLATGRMYRSAMKIAELLKVEAPLITYNGALIKSTAGEVIDEDCLSAELVRELIEFGRERGWHVQTYADDVLRFAEMNKYAERYMGSVKIDGAAVGWEALSEHAERVYKLLLVTDGAEDSHGKMAELEGSFGARIDVATSNPEYVEIVSKGVSKGSALVKLASKLGVTIGETLAIGDSENDVPMLKAAGVSVAMGNAADKIKAACDHVVGLCVEDGFADAVDKFVLDKK